MKKSILVAAIVSLLSVSGAYAQDAPKKEKGEKQMHDKRASMYDDLNLTADQQTKMTALSEDGRAKMEAVRNDASLSDDQKKEKMKSLRAEQKEARDKILTKEQSEKLEAKMKDRQSKRRGNDKPQQQ